MVVCEDPWWMQGRVLEYFLWLQPSWDSPQCTLLTVIRSPWRRRGRTLLPTMWIFLLKVGAWSPRWRLDFSRGVRYWLRGGAAWISHPRTPADESWEKVREAVWERQEAGREEGSAEAVSAGQGCALAGGGPGGAGVSTRQVH